MHSPSTISSHSSTVTALPVNLAFALYRCQSLVKCSRWSSGESNAVLGQVWQRRDPSGVNEALVLVCSTRLAFEEPACGVAFADSSGRASSWIVRTARLDSSSGGMEKTLMGRARRFVCALISGACSRVYCS